MKKSPLGQLQFGHLPWRTSIYYQEALRRCHSYPDHAEIEHFKARIKDWGRRPTRSIVAPAFAAWMGGELELTLELATCSPFVVGQVLRYRDVVWASVPRRVDTLRTAAVRSDP